MTKLANLHTLASRIIPTEAFQYRTLLSIETNSIGNIVANYTSWIPIIGHVQSGLAFSFNSRGIANTSEIAKELGIDQSKEVVTVYVSNINLRNVHDQDNPDQIMYQGKIYNIWSISNWYNYNGWKFLVCVEDSRKRTINEQ